MKHLLTAAAFLAACACAKKEEAAPAAETNAPAPIAAEDLAAPADPQTVAAAPTEEEPAMTCPVIDSRTWKAWTAPDGTGMTLHISGEVDLPTPGYAAILRLGASDRAMPPGQRVHLDLTPPEGLVAQVVTATRVALEAPGAYPEYRNVTVLCGDATIAEIADVGSGSN